MGLDMLYYQNISGPERRIAHTAKVDASHFVSLSLPHPSLPASGFLEASGFLLALNIKLHTLSFQALSIFYYLLPFTH